MENSVKTPITFSSSRVEAFSDGIFAIAITLLVLNIQLPPNAFEIGINKALLLSIPKLEIWVISFLIIGGMWVRHHNLIKIITQIDTLFIKLNLIYLMFVTIIPWLVSLIVIYNKQPMAIAVFSGGIVLLCFINLFMWIYLSKIKKTISRDITNYEKNLISLRILINILICAVTIFIAYTVNNRIALFCYLLNPFIDCILKFIFKEKKV